jgi:Archaeal/vacuolar-type H+-ATPase subunit F
MADFFVVAEEEIVLAFRMVGVDGRAVSGREEALDAFRYATGRGSDPSGRPYKGIGAKVLVLTEDVADMLEAEALEWQLEGSFPLIVEIPSRSGPKPGRKSLVDAVREAVGVGI